MTSRDTDIDILNNLLIKYASENNTSKVMSLIAMGAKMTTNRGKIFLFAIMHSNDELIHFYLKNNFYNCFSQTQRPLRLAIISHNNFYAFLFIKYGAKFDLSENSEIKIDGHPFILSILYNNYIIFNHFIDKINLDFYIKQGIYHAAINNNTKFLEKMLEFPIKQEILNDALIESVRNKKYNNVVLLVNKKADIHVNNNYPLFLAKISNETQICDFLIQSGANSDNIDYEFL